MGNLSVLQGEYFNDCFNTRLFSSYFQAYKHTEDYGGQLSLGYYVSGEGTFDSDPMIFTAGDSINCGNGANRDSIAYWYCWYDAFPSPIVGLDEL